MYINHHFEVLIGWFVDIFIKPEYEYLENKTEAEKRFEEIQKLRRFKTKEGQDYLNKSYREKVSDFVE